MESAYSNDPIRSSAWAETHLQIHWGFRYAQLKLAGQEWPMFTCLALFHSQEEQYTLSGYINLLSKVKVRGKVIPVLN